MNKKAILRKNIARLNYLLQYHPGNKREIARQKASLRHLKRA